MQEIWTIYEAYIHYLVNIGKNKTSANDGRFTKFRLYCFLNDTPIFSKDKRGMNVAILSIQILFLIQEKSTTRLLTGWKPSRNTATGTKKRRHHALLLLHQDVVIHCRGKFSSPGSDSKIWETC